MRRRKKLSRLIAWVSLVLLVSGCGGFPEVAQPYGAGMTVGEIYGPHIVGQTFIAHHKGLCGIEVLLATYARENQGKIIFHLRESLDSTDIASVEVPAKAIQDNAFHRFSFPALPDSAGKSYYFFLESPDSRPGDAITAWQGTANSYKERVLYLDGDPQSGQLVFIIRYHLLWVARELVQAFLANLDTAILAVSLFLLPGYATLSVLHPRLNLDVPQRLMVSAGLSVAVLPLLLFGSSLLGLKLGPLSVASLFLFLGIVSIWRVRGDLLRRSSWKRFRAQIDAIYLLLLVVFALGVLVRFLIVRDLVAPMWGDSYHHTMISQLLVDNGGLFSSWEPYAPLRSFTYHFGFHSLVAFYHWLTGVEVIDAVIIVGQILNALSIPLAYLLTDRLTKERWAALIAALITALLSPMPLYYVNWGRYTQLAGQVILPVAMIFLMDSLEGRRWPLRSWILTTLALAGLILTHYLVVVYYAAFALIYLMWSLVAEGRRGGLILFRMVAVAFGAALLTTPWLVNLSINLLPSYISPPVRFSREYLDLYFTFPGIGAYVSYLLGGLALLGTALAFLRREKGGILVVLWTAVLCLAANAYRSGLPGSGLVNYFAILIAAYLPVSILAGLFFARLIETFGLERSKGQGVLVVLVLGAALVGTLNSFAPLNSSYMLVHSADAEAMDWIAANTPPSAKFLVNSFSASGEGGIIVGSDAGWWIPLWTGRENSVPPINYMWERIEQADFDEIYALAGIDLKRMESPDTLSVLERYGITHVYMGTQGGRMKAEIFARSPIYREIYAQGGVTIFEIEYGSDTGGRES